MSESYTQIVVVPYDTGWPADYQGRAGALDEALGDVAMRIEHIGSTAVPGLAAKPTIDIQVSAADLAPLDRYRRPLEALGYAFHEPSLVELDHRFFQAAARAAHIHVCPAGGDWERRHLLFRDYLREHPEDAAHYASLKRSLALAFRLDREGYLSAKSDYIEAALQRADTWAAATGWSLGEDDGE